MPTARMVDLHGSRDRRGVGHDGMRSGRRMRHAEDDMNTARLALIKLAIIAALLKREPYYIRLITSKLP